MVWWRCESTAYYHCW